MSFLKHPQKFHFFFNSPLEFPHPFCNTTSGSMSSTKPPSNFSGIAQYMLPLNQFCRTRVLQNMSEWRGETRQPLTITSQGQNISLVVQCENLKNNCIISWLLFNCLYVRLGTQVASTSYLHNITNSANYAFMDGRRKIEFSLFLTTFLCPIRGCESESEIYQPRDKKNETYLSKAPYILSSKLA